VFTVDRAAPTITPSCPVSGGSYKTNGNGSGTWSKSCNNQLSGSTADTGGSGVSSVTVSVQQGSVSTAVLERQRLHRDVPEEADGDVERRDVDARTPAGEPELGQDLQRHRRCDRRCRQHHDEDVQLHDDMTTAQRHDDR
jgi:hypothetical protein